MGLFELLIKNEGSMFKTRGVVLHIDIWFWKRTKWTLCLFKPLYTSSSLSKKSISTLFFIPLLNFWSFCCFAAFGCRQHIPTEAQPMCQVLSCKCLQHAVQCVVNIRSHAWVCFCVQHTKQCPWYRKTWMSKAIKFRCGNEKPMPSNSLVNLKIEPSSRWIPLGQTSWVYF